jgi:hypothetical protein
MANKILVSARRTAATSAPSLVVRDPISSLHFAPRTAPRDSVIGSGANRRTSSNSSGGNRTGTGALSRDRLRRGGALRLLVLRPGVELVLLIGVICADGGEQHGLEQQHSQHFTGCRAGGRSAGASRIGCTSSIRPSSRQ